MKKYAILALTVLIALVLSSCSMHLGLGKLINGGSPKTTKAKHIKATHTPPSPPTGTPGAMEAPMLTPSAANAITITSTRYQPNSVQVKAGSPITWTNADNVGIFDSGPLNPKV